MGARYVKAEIKYAEADEDENGELRTAFSPRSGFQTGLRSRPLPGDRFAEFLGLFFGVFLCLDDFWERTRA